MKPSFSILIVSILFLTACGGRSVSSGKAARTPAPGGSYASLSAAQLHVLLNKKNFVLIWSRNVKSRTQ